MVERGRADTVRGREGAGGGAGGERSTGRIGVIGEAAGEAKGVEGKSGRRTRSRNYVDICAHQYLYVITEANARRLSLTRKTRNIERGVRELEVLEALVCVDVGEGRGRCVHGEGGRLGAVEVGVKVGGGLDVGHCGR